MADWNLPAITTAYVEFLNKVKDRDVDAATLFVADPTNPVTGMIRYVRASNKFQEYNGSIWVDKILSVAGGGTGASTAGGARTNLGIGGIATQESDNVNITGGSITGLSSLSVTGVTNLTGGVQVPNAVFYRGKNNVSTYYDLIGINSSNNIIIGDLNLPTVIAAGGKYFNFTSSGQSWGGGKNLEDSNLARTSGSESIIGAWIFSAGVEIYSSSVNAILVSGCGGGYSGISITDSANPAIKIDTTSGSNAIQFSGSGVGMVTALTGDLYIQTIASNTTIKLRAANADVVTISSFLKILTVNNYIVDVADKANSNKEGSGIDVGRNTDGTGAPGWIRLKTKNGALYALWVDNSGKLRIRISNPPFESESDTVGTIVGTQS